MYFVSSEHLLLELAIEELLDAGRDYVCRSLAADVLFFRVSRRGRVAVVTRDMRVVAWRHSQALGEHFAAVVGGAEVFTAMGGVHRWLLVNSWRAEQLDNTLHCVALDRLQPRFSRLRIRSAVPDEGPIVQLAVVRRRLLWVIAVHMCWSIRLCLFVGRRLVLVDCCKASEGSLSCDGRGH